MEQTVSPEAKRRGRRLLLWGAVLAVAAVILLAVALRPLPQALLDLQERNPETESYVENYRKKRWLRPEIDLSADVIPGQTPLFIQWDQRWGYAPYGGDEPEDMIGLSGCGPTALSMVVVGLTGDQQWNPRAVADFSVEDGHYAPGYGTAWTLMSEGSEKLGVDCGEIPLLKQSLVDALEDGKLIIASVTKGDFTQKGHFIVLCGWNGEAFEIRDPNSMIRSAQTWTYERLEPQIVGLWAFSAAE